MTDQKRNYTVVIVILITFFVISFLTNILGALNPSATASFQLTETMAGFLPFSFFIAYGIMSIPAGFLLERYGEKSMMITGFLLALGGSIIFALFPHFKVFLISLFIIGSGMAILQVVINPLLRVAGGEEHYAFNSVLAQLCFGAASFISPMVYSWIILNIHDTALKDVIAIREAIASDKVWITIYWLFAAISALMILIVFFISFPSNTLKEDERLGNFQMVRNMLRNRTVLLYFFGIFMYVGTEQGISYWMSKFLNIYHGFNFETTGASAVGRFWGLMTIGGVAGLLLLKLFDSKLVLKWFSVLAIISLGLALFAPAQISLFSFQASGFFLAVMYPIIISLGLNSITKHHGSAAGIFMSGIMGGAVVQIIIGAVGDLVSLKTGMLIIFICLSYILSIGFWAQPLVKNKTIQDKK